MQEKVVKEGSDLHSYSDRLTLLHCRTDRVLTGGLVTLGHMRRKGKRENKWYFGNIQVFRGYQISQERGLCQ